MSGQSVPFKTYAAQLEQSWDTYDVDALGGDTIPDIPTTPQAGLTGGDHASGYQEEMEGLQTKLNDQMELNTGLMDEVSHLTKENNKSLLELKEKQRNLQAVLRALDEVKRQNDNLKGKIEKQVADNSKTRRSEQEVKIALTVSERNRESLDSVLKETKRELQSVREQRDIAKDQCTMLQEKHNELANSYDVSNKQNGDMPLRLKELERMLEQKSAEIQHLTDAKEVASGEVNELKRGMLKETSAARRAQTEKSRAEAELHRIKDQSQRQEAHEHELQTMIDRLRDALGKSEKEVDRLRVNASANKRKEEDITQQAQAIAKRCHQSEQSLANVRNQFEEHQEKMSEMRQTYLNEKINYENQLETMRNEVQDAIQAGHESSMMNSRQLKQAQDDYREKLDRMDNQYISLQNEYTTLNQVLEKVQKDKTMKLEEFEEERRVFREKLHELTELRQIEAEVAHENETRHKVERARLVDEIARMEEELQGVLSSYGGELAHIKSSLAGLARGCKEYQTDFNEVVGKVKSMASRVNMFSDQVWKPIEKYSSMLKNGLQKVQQENVLLRSRLEDTKDQLATSMLQRDDEHGQLIMTQDTIGRLQHQLAALRSRLESEVSQAEEKARKADGNARASAKLRNDMEARLHAKMQEVEKTNRTNTTLQLDRQHLYDDLAKSQSQLTRSLNEEKEKYNQLSTNLRRCEQKLQDTQRELALVQRDYKTTATRADMLAGDRSNMQEAIVKLKTHVKNQEGQHVRNTKSLKSELSKLHEQMGRTRELYQQAKQARDHLREDNINLKTEMDKILVKSEEMEKKNRG
jgi:chromosome segregation ATPase